MVSARSAVRSHRLSDCCFDTWLLTKAAFCSPSQDEFVVLALLWNCNHAPASSAAARLATAKPRLLFRVFDTSVSGGLRVWLYE